MLIVCLTLPEAAASKLAHDTDPTTAGDAGYVLKSVLHEVMGPIEVRPFRGLCRDGVLKIVGFAAIEEPVKPTASAEKLGCRVEFLPWEAKAGDEIVLDVLACPLQSVTAPKGETAGRKIDVARVGVHTSRLSAYEKWLRARLKDPANGCTQLAMFRFAEAGRFEAVRKSKSHNRGTRVLTMPMFAGTVKVRVDDPAAFSRFLATGLGKQRGFGYGAAIPQEILHDLAA